MPLSGLLAVDHEFDLLVRWQRISRAAASGEHDFTSCVRLGRLTTAQARTVIKDVADAIRGLVVLDQRYENIPGWRRLPEPARINLAAENVSQQIGGEAQDLGVDRHGWRRAPAAIQLRRLSTPEPWSPIRPLGTPRWPHRTGRPVPRTRTGRPDTGSAEPEPRRTSRRWRARGRREPERSRRLRGTSIHEPGQNTALHDLQRLFTSTDAHITATIDRGLHERLYFVSVRVPEEDRP